MNTSNRPCNGDWDTKGFVFPRMIGDSDAIGYTLVASKPYLHVPSRPFESIHSNPLHGEGTYAACPACPQACPAAVRWQSRRMQPNSMSFRTSKTRIRHFANRESSLPATIHLLESLLTSHPLVRFVFLS